MRIALVVLAACGGTSVAPHSAPVASPAPDRAFEPLRALLGHWQGTDPDRHSTGEFTLAADVGGKVLVRRNTNDSPQGHHEDLMIIYPTPAGLRATYVDNEGHVIQYGIAASGTHVELLSDDVPGQPRFKLTYDAHGADELVIDFAMAMPGSTELVHYTGGTVHRVP